MASLKLIIDEETVRNRLTLEDKEDINNAIAEGLNAAHAFFQGVLGTAFEENIAAQDVFYLDTDLIPVLPNKQYRLRLTQALVKPGSVSMKYSDTRQEALAATADVLPSDDFYVDDERGLVYIDAEGTSQGYSYAKKFVVVTYQAGIGATTGVKAPPWLVEAVIAWMPSFLLYTSHGQEPDKILKTVQSIQGQASNMVNRYKRETALQFLPIY